jgi:glyoxylase-like metal-dependent hydrolase (beta-lactamase superfamily II)
MPVTEIAPGVYTADHRVVEGKNGIVFGTRGALAIDSGTDPDEGQLMADFIRQAGREPNRLAYTHSHGDHALGSAAFRGAEVFAHARTTEGIRAQLARRAERAGTTVEELGKAVAWPTVTFTRELGMDLGGKTLRFLSTPGHSPDSACVYLEEDRILFGGDTVVTAIIPAFGNGDSRKLEASLHSLTSLGAEVLVPGHGHLLRGAAEIREWLEFLASYVAGTRTVVKRVLAEKRSLEGDALVDAILEEAPFERHAAGRFDPEQHRQPMRHRAAIAKMVEEESAT